ncbi:WhiB family transcriptional regulator [Streptomyces sp. V4-01]|uniref:WhiB family transcriptional regulator n=1 Tax=Actinacidiphila polyblastidii TaxID=3110430 RepID=A0ABU7P6V0_9ACTN|nr:WhiB family transcriptional regulator [Streptomyces sp. V4-01]
MAGHHAPDTLQRSDAWALRAACGSRDKETFFNERFLADARAVCQGCPVREQCLDEALAVEGDASEDWRFGIYGGLTAKERVQLAAERKTGRSTRRGRPPAPCPSESAYNRHVRKGEPIDDGCRLAHNAAARAERSASTKQVSR